MIPCDQFQNQLLDYLYGLIDAPEVEQLAAHLNGCAACRQALAQAEGHKKLLAAAAKLEFAELSFQNPVIPMATPRKETAAVGSSGGERGWGRWALAAAVLLAVGGVSLSTLGYWGKRDRVLLTQARTEQLQKDVARLSAERAAKLAAPGQEIQELDRMIGALAQEHSTAVQQVSQTLAKQPLRLQISGPAAPEAGALNEYQIAVFDRSRPSTAQVTAKVLGRDNKELVANLDLQPQGPGRYKMSLPRDLPAKPNSDLFLVVNAKSGDAARGELTEKLTLAPPVYLTHLATDKPMYQPGEIVHFRSLTLERFGLKPAQEDLRLQFEIAKPTGEKAVILAGPARVADQGSRPILGPDKEPVRGIGAGDYALDAEAPGGEYVLTVREAAGKFPPQERKFIVNRYEKSRLNKDLDFTKKSYGPGDDVVANGKAFQAETNLPVADRPVTATVRVDGNVTATLSLRTTAAGAVRVPFRLPTKIAKGQASLALRFDDGGNVETIVRPIPIVLKKLQVDFFPEGGDLVAGLANRVYFQARTTLDKPAELQGRIVDESGAVRATVRTLNDPDQPGVNQGMGRFEFQPEAGKKYQLKIDAPAGIEGEYPLPDVKADGVVLTVATGVTSDKEPIRVAVASGHEDRQLLIGAYCRGRLMTHQRVRTTAGQTTNVELQPEAGTGGVFRVTVFEEQNGPDDRVRLVPKAERLVYRVPAQRLNVSVEPDKKEYAPGDKVTLHYQAKNEAGKPAPAVVMVAVVDTRVLKTADEKTYRNMPTHFLLTTEVRRPEDLEYADFLLSKHPKAGQALDLLLGTQGWRRFAEQEPPAQFRQRDPREATRLMAANGRLSAATLGPKITDSNALAWQQVNDQFALKYQKLQDRKIQAQAKQVEAQAEGERLQGTIAQLRVESGTAGQEYRASLQNLENYRELFRSTLLPLLIGMLVLAAVVGLVVGLLRFGGWNSLPYLATAVCSILILGVVVALQMRSTVAMKAPEGQVAQSTVTNETWRAAGHAKGDKVEVIPAAPQPQAREEELRKKNLPMDAKNAPMGEAKALPAGVPGRGMAPQPMMAPGAKPGGVLPLTKAAVADDKAKGEGKTNQKRMLPQNFKKEIMDADGQRNVDRLEKQAEQAANGPAAPFARRAKVQDMGKNKEPALRQLKDAEGPMPAEPEMIGRAFGAQPAGAARGGAAPAMPGFAGPGGAGALRGRRNGNFGYAVLEPPPPPLIVREYAHQRVGGEEGVRSDFTETLLWNPVLVLPDGKGESSFELCDSTTTFQILAAGHTSDGRLGAVTTELTARKPLTVEPKLPVEVTASDRIDVPLAIANNTGLPQVVSLGVRPTGLNLLNGPENARLTLTPHQRNRQLYRFQPSLIEGEATLRFEGQSGQYTDSILRTVKVVPEGFPVVGAQSDLLEKVARHDLLLPPTWIKGTLKYQVTVYPSTLADLQKGLESLLREPNGCFEQTSTSNYPNLLILDYLKESDQANPAVARRAQDLLDRGYKKLTSFECLNAGKNQREGYEWFGGTAPAHEALTAYGLLEFRDMARVYPVDRAMLERTKNYLLSRRDGKGGFLRNPRAIDSFGRAPDQVTNAYIVWALTESGKEDDVTKELNALAEQAKSSKDPYFVALVANGLLNRNRAPEGIDLLKKLAEAQKPDGHLDAAQTSITGSGGRDLQIETTALTLLGWLKTMRPELFNVPTQKAVGWIGKQRGGHGGFGSTQSTILALKALIAYAKANKKTAEAGELILYVADQPVVRRQYAAGAQDAIVLELPEPEKHLKPGKNELRVEITGKSVFPYTAGWAYQSLQPASAEKCPVGLTTTLDRAAAAEGETVGLKVQVDNRSGKGQGMAVAIIGLPAGLTLPEDMKQLKDMARLRENGTKRGAIDAWETRGRELILYWRDLVPDQKLEVHLDLICRVPGEYQGPASRAYLYYNADHKFWAEPLKMAIQAKAE